MMQSTTRHLWRKWATRRCIGLSRTTTAAAIAAAEISIQSLGYSRSFAAAAMPHSEPDPTNDWVRATIHKLLEEESTKTLPVETKRDSTPRDLDKSLQRLQNQIEEAEMCIKDCRDCDPDQLPDELASAESSVDLAVACLVDLIDDLRVSGHENKEQFLKTRSGLVERIRQLRSDLVALKKKVK